MDALALSARLQPNPPNLLLHPSSPSTVRRVLLPQNLIDEIQFRLRPSLRGKLLMQSQRQSLSVFCSKPNTLIQEAPLASDVPYELADIDWDSLGFALMPTDYMYIMKCSQGQSFTKGELQRFGNIELSPSAGVLNYGQGLFEGLKAYRKDDGNILLFRPEDNAFRLRMGAERMCMPSPTIEQFVDAVTATVLANKQWVPPPGKGSLYIRPVLMGSGAVLALAPSPSPEYTFVIHVSPVGNYFKEGIAPIHLVINTEVHQATPGGTGGVTTIGNYASYQNEVFSKEIEEELEDYRKSKSDENGIVKIII